MTPTVYLGRERNFTGQHFWARGYYVSTVGLDEVAVRQYIVLALENMDSQLLPSPALLDCINHLRTTVSQLTRLLDALIAVTINLDSTKSLRREDTPVPNPLAQVLPAMLQAAGSSSHTLTLLSEAPGLQTRDCYSIARSVIEIAVNICYIIAEGSPAADRALRHARQKMYQDLERESKIGDKIIRLTFSDRLDTSTVPGLKAEIAEFTSRTGREKGWVDLSIDERIEAAGQKLGDSVLTSLHFARFMIYRHSSEVLHGTLFSALYFFGITTPSTQPRTQDKTLESVGQQHMLILIATVFALSAVIEAFHRAYGFAEAKERSKSLLDGLHDIPYFNQG